MNSKPSAQATTAKGLTDPATAWLSVKDAAAALGVVPRTVRRRIERGQLAGKSVALDGGGRAWLVSLDKDGLQPGDDRAANRTDSVRTACGQRTDHRTDSPANRSNERESERTDSERTANGQPNGQRTDSVRTANGQASNRREIEQQDEIKFLRGVIEQLQRDGAETRAALRSALKLAAGDAATAPQLTAGDRSAPEKPAPGATPSGTPERGKFDPLDPTTGGEKRAAPLTYNDIADQLERDLAARDFNPG